MADHWKNETRVNDRMVVASFFHTHLWRGAIVAIWGLKTRGCSFMTCFILG